MQTEEIVHYDLHTIESAPDHAKPFLEEANQQYGMVPNLYAMMSNAPILLDSYLYAYKLFREKGSFNPVEQEVIFLSISRENSCHYCMAAHSMVGKMMSKVPDETLEALRNDTAIPDAKLAALSTFTKIMVAKRGLPSPEEVETFLAAGYNANQILEIVTAIGIKIFSNYANHLAYTPVDAGFSAFAWEAK